MTHQPIDTQFYAPRLPVSIAGLPNAEGEAQAVRAALEWMGCTVLLHGIGMPQDFLKVLGQGEGAPRYLVISGHGDDQDGYYFGEYAPFLDVSMLRNQHLPAEVIAPVVNLPGCTVISSTCWGGVEAMARAFVTAGRVNAYIGCRDAPDGSDMLVYLVQFFHGVLRKKLSDHEAWKRAMIAVDQPDTYQMSYFHADGSEDRYEQHQGEIQAGFTTDAP